MIICVKFLGFRGGILFVVFGFTFLSGLGLVILVVVWWVCCLVIDWWWFDVLIVLV